MPGRGRPKGTVKNKIGTHQINEWSIIWHNGGDNGKAFVTKEINSLKLEKDAIIERMAIAHEKNRNPELAKVLRDETNLVMANVEGIVAGDEFFQKLSKLAPRDSLIINLKDLSIMRKKTPVPRTKQ